MSPPFTNIGLLLIQKNIGVLTYKKRKMHRHALQNKRLARFLTTRTSNFRKGSQNVRKEYLEKSAGSGSIQLSVFGDVTQKKLNGGGGVLKSPRQD